MTSVPGYTSGSVRTWLRVEGLVVLCLAALLYNRGDYSWWLFALLFLAPDLSFLGYLAGPRVGAVVYNVLHSYAAPLLAAVICIVAGLPLALPLVWVAHIGFDRLAGYGLKYPTSFGDTHLGRIGRMPGAADRKAGSS